MHLFEAVAATREAAIGVRLSAEGNLWSAILQQIKAKDCFDHRYLEALEQIIGSLVADLEDDRAVSMWRESETGLANNAGDEELIFESVCMDLEVEILEEITKVASEDAKRTTQGPSDELASRTSVFPMMATRQS